MLEQSPQVPVAVAVSEQSHALAVPRVILVPQRPPATKDRSLVIRLRTVSRDNANFLSVERFFIRIPFL
jgi:hypothetical protein